MCTPRSAFRFLSVLSFVLLGAEGADAQWLLNGLPVGSESGSSMGKVVPDATGGAFLSYQDYSNRDLSSDDAYVVRLDASGMLAPGWTAMGRAVSTTRSSDRTYAGVGNADGSATFTFWTTARRLQAARLLPSGSFVPGWPAGTITVAPGPSQQAEYQVCPAPDGGNFFLWAQSGTPDVWMQRLNADGTVAAGWPAGGHEVASGPSWDLAGTLPSLLPDGEGGAWIATYTSISATDGDARVLRVDGLGNPRPGFPLYGKSVVSTPNVVQSIPGIAPDGAGGVYVAWPDGRSGTGVEDPYVQQYFDIYVQRFTATGDVAPGWPADGLPVCTSPGGQYDPMLVPDGGGGVFITWFGGGPQGPALHAQHVLGDASTAPGWPLDGKLVYANSGSPSQVRVCTDQRGGIFVAAEVDAVVWLQHMNGSGSFDSPWGAAGLRVVDASIPVSYSNIQQYPEMAPSLPGSVILCWDDLRSLPARVFVSRISVDGVVATNASLVSHEEAADHVALAWFVSEASGAALHVERREESGAWRSIAEVAADGTGIARYDDQDVRPETRYAYRLRWSVGSESAYSAESWITVPTRARFALVGATPNPSPRGKLAIAYSLAERAPAKLELFDAQGRCVATRDVGALGLGAHMVSFDETHSLRAGLYWARLTQGAQQATSRVVIVD